MANIEYSSEYGNRVYVNTIGGERCYIKMSSDSVYFPPVLTQASDFVHGKTASDVMFYECGQVNDYARGYYDAMRDLGKDARIIYHDTVNRMHMQLVCHGWKEC